MKAVRPLERHDVDTLAAATGDQLMELLGRLDAGRFPAGEDATWLRMMVRREVHCRVGNVVAEWAADPEWRPTPEQRPALEKAVRVAAPLIEDYVSRLRTTLSRQVRAYVGVLQAKKQQWGDQGYGPDGLASAMRRHGFPGVLTSMPRGDVAPVAAADTLSQLVAVASVGGDLGQEAAEGAYDFAVSLGYTGRRPVVDPAGLSADAAAQLLESLTPDLIRTLKPTAVGGGSCRPVWRPPTTQVLSRAVAYADVAPALNRRVNALLEKDVRTALN